MVAGLVIVPVVSLISPKLKKRDSRGCVPLSGRKSNGRAETGTAGRGRIEFIKEGERFDPQTGYVYQRNRNTVVL